LTNRKKISLVVPVYFEQECIAQFIKETKAVLQTLPLAYEWVFVDDGSEDETVSIIKTYAAKDPAIKLIELSYNHGKQGAVTAGIRYATGDYLLYMDPDLQDPPKEIPRFIDKIEEGYDVVFGIRSIKMDSWLNKLFSKLFWGILNRFTGLQIPEGLAVMRIFNRKFADKFNEYGEHNRFIEGIFMHIGMKRTTLKIGQRERFAGKTKFNFSRKIALAFNAILDFSQLPLLFVVRFGFLLSLLGFLALIGIVIAKLFFIEFQAGWPSLISAIILGTGLQIFFMGIVAVYIGKIYKESKPRPLFSVKECTNIDEE
jgi:dolichol-phosphate mannosyltransferase